jgi:phosphoribosylformylglycinamidine synthase subunit PurL
MIDTEIKVTPQIAAEHGLTADEYARIQKILGRDPNITELGIFSVSWSEHCSYKSSRVHLRRLPTRGTHVVQGPGENAGVVDIGDGLVAVFKIESHNHPSFVEPFQGAATGVGGILRDIFTMGARPVAVLDSLRFGEISSGRGAAGQKETPDEIAHNRRILDGVVHGIAHYGNCFGVPTVAGEVLFEPCYANNPLVNALALGVAHRDELFFARAQGPGNPVIYVGAKTGRDGIHGASLLASSEFSEESEQKRPNVQVGDPFMEKLLLEACLEAMRTGAIVAIQDMGAAGLTSSSCEMASRGGVGIELELARIPQREAHMTAYEMMLSESQERMLLVAQRGRQNELFDVFHKWGLDAVEVGIVTDDGKLRLLHHGKVVAEIPAHALAEEGPRYERPIARPSAAKSPQELAKFAAPGADLTENFRQLLASPAIASKNWITEQYDSMVQTNTRFGPGAADAAVIRLKESKRALAVKTDGNGRWCVLSPRIGAMHAVAEAARNVACTGARPVAATNCLNFGNPEKPEVMWQFTEAIEGLSEACTALDTPITGGNVSFYNETLGKPIYPTPILGVLGILEDAEFALGSAFQSEGDAIVLLDAGSTAAPGAAQQQREFSSSEYAKITQGVVAGDPPSIDLAAEKNLIDCLVDLASQQILASAHDVSDGGIAVALAESCFAAPPGLSADVALTEDAPGQPAEAALFGERGARAVVSVKPALLARIAAIAAEYKVGAAQIGSVTRGEFHIQFRGVSLIHGPLAEFFRAWSESLGKQVESA